MYSLLHRFVSHAVLIAEGHRVPQREKLCALTCLQGRGVLRLMAAAPAHLT